jgi:hypothetical protein
MRSSASSPDGGARQNALNRVGNLIVRSGMHKAPQFAPLENLGYTPNGQRNHGCSTR